MIYQRGKGDIPGSKVVHIKGFDSGIGDFYELAGASATDLLGETVA